MRLMKLRVKSFVYGLLSSFGFLCFLILLSDAKVMKDVLKYHVVGYFAHNVA